MVFTLGHGVMDRVCSTGVWAYFLLSLPEIRCARKTLNNAELTVRYTGMLPKSHRKALMNKGKYQPRWPCVVLADPEDGIYQRPLYASRLSLALAATTSSLGR